MLHSKYKTIILDFDGTIVDSFSLLVETYNEVAHRFGMTKLSQEQTQKLRDYSFSEILRFVPWYKRLQFIWVLKKVFFSKISQVQLIPGMDDILLDLKKTGANVGVVSNNQTKNIQKYFDQEKLPKLDFLYCTRGITGKDRLLKKLIRGKNIDPLNAVYIGDEIRDVEMCKKLSLPIISVDWGLNSHKVLSKINPCLVSSTDQLNQLLFENYLDQT